MTIEIHMYDFQASTEIKMAGTMFETKKLSNPSPPFVHKVL